MGKLFYSLACCMFDTTRYRPRYENSKNLRPGVCETAREAYNETKGACTSEEDCSYRARIPVTVTFSDSNATFTTDAYVYSNKQYISNITKMEEQIVEYGGEVGSLHECLTTKRDNSGTTCYIYKRNDSLRTSYIGFLVGGSVAGLLAIIFIYLGMCIPCL